MLRFILIAALITGIYILGKVLVGEIGIFAHS